MENEQQAYICPVCGCDDGLVLPGFYNQYSGAWLTTSTPLKICKFCNGEGIVWEEAEKPV
jgi:hypothetical protein